MILICLFLASLYTAPKSPKVSPEFRNWLSSKVPESQVKIWVFFTDKGIFKESEYQEAIKLAEHSMPGRVRTQRLKVRKSGELCDFSDIPVCKEYVEQTQKLGAKRCVISKWLNAVSFKTPAKFINEIEALSFVKEIRKVMVYRCEDDLKVKEIKGINYGENCKEQLQALNVPIAHDSGYSGNGVVVGVLDAGFELRYHECLQHLRNKIVAKYDFVGDIIEGNPGDTTVCYDLNNPADKKSYFRHGSRMLSLIAGAKSAEVVGPAYRCSLALARTELDYGKDIIAEEDCWIAGAEWLTDSIGVAIISNSLGYKNFDTTGNQMIDFWYGYREMNGYTTPISIVASMLAGKGVLLITAMGNIGTNEVTFSPDTCIAAPADAFHILAVGGVLKEENVWKWAWFGNWGSAIGPPYDSTRFKPDVCGPWYAYLINDPDSSSSYGLSQGTSCATALVAGVCALILEAHPKWGPMEIREAILNTASNHNSPNDTIGYGRPDAYKSIYKELPDVRPHPFARDEIFNIHPNPFRLGKDKEIEIPYQITNDSYVHLRIYTLSGRIVKEFEAPNRTLGRHMFKWDGRTNDGKLVGSGIYICLLQTYGDNKDIKKFAVIR